MRFEKEQIGSENLGVFEANFQHDLIEIFFGFYSDGKEGGSDGKEGSKDAHKDGCELGLSRLNAPQNIEMDYIF